MRLITFNLNGIRAATRRGFRAWLDRSEADVIALQEVRAPAGQVPPEAIQHWHFAYDSGQLAGRNGVALLSKSEPVAVRIGLDSDSEFGADGRYIEADYDLAGGPVTVASLYLPKGAVPSDSEAAAKYERKLRFCQALEHHLAATLQRAGQQGRQFSLLGDYNIARTPQDLHNNKSKQPLDGFLPEERDWFTTLLEHLPLTDVVRQLQPEGQGPYSWWSWRGQSWLRDHGWRIDYHLSTPELALRAQAGWTDRSETYEARVSDHAPVIVDYA